MKPGPWYVAVGTYMLGFHQFAGIYLLVGAALLVFDAWRERVR
jgi:hypothetical protein